MAIIAPLFAMLGRFLGRVLTMALGWATILLFGRVPQSKQLLLSMISLGSLAWVLVLVAALVPDVGGMLLAGRGVPDVIQPYVQVILIVLAIVIPIGVGVGGYLMLAEGDRPKAPLGVAKQLVRGYPYAAALAVTLAFMTIVAPIRRLRSVLKHWEDAHIPVVVKPGGYERVADDLEKALDEANVEVDRRRAPRVLEVPSKLLAAVAGAGVRNLVPDRLIVLGSDQLEILIHPSDISLAGRKEQLARARAAVATRLTFTQAYLTSTEEAQEVEDRLAELVESAPGVAPQDPRGSPADAGRLEDVRGRFADIDRRLADLVVPYDEWEVLHRLRLQVERDVLQQRDAMEGRPPSHAAEGAEGLLGGPQTATAPASGSAPGPSPLQALRALIDAVARRLRLGRIASAIRRRSPQPHA